MGRRKNDNSRHRVYQLRLSDDDYEKLDLICENMGYKNRAEAIRDSIRTMYNLARFRGKNE